MLWLALTVHIAFNVLLEMFSKQLMRTLPKGRTIQWQFIFCALFAIVYAVALREWRTDTMSLLILLMGIVNALATYCWWQAIERSLSKSSLLLPLAPIWASVLVLLFLREHVLWSNAVALSGVALLHAAAFLLVWSKGVRWKGEWLLWGLGYVALYAVIFFLIKVASLSIPTGQFLSAWYAGSALGAFCIAQFLRDRHFSAVQIVRVLPVAAVLIGGMATFYWALRLGDASVVLAIVSFLGPIPAMFVGWFWFQETRELRLTHVIGFAVGIAGCILVAIGLVR